MTNEAFSEFLPFLLFGIVYGLIILRNIRGFKFPIWATMSFGAIAAVVLQFITPYDAYSAINFDVIGFLLGMFILVAGLESSGIIGYLTLRILGMAKTPNRVLLFILAVLGPMSAFLINDTVALVATPIVIGFASRMKVNHTPFLISLAFGVTIGSTFTPIGNPQNLLISLDSGMSRPFLDFVLYLTAPTTACIFVTYLLVTKFYKKYLSGAAIPAISTTENVIIEPRLAKTTSIIFLSALVGFFLVGMIQSLGHQTQISYSHVALFGGLLLLAVSNKRKTIIRETNWRIIVFFIAMFVFMAGMWHTRVISAFSGLFPIPNPSDGASALFGIVVTSLGLSQAMSNVPFVAVYLPLMHNLGFAGTDTIFWLALASASTLAGNLTILGAASNIIILEAAEKKGIHAFSFWEFLKIGSIVTAANLAILCSFLFVYLLTSVDI